MAKSHSNVTILEQLKHGSARFEIVSDTFSFGDVDVSQATTSFMGKGGGFFARIGAFVESSAMRKLEHFTVQKVTGDGRCMFRALVKGMAANRGVVLSPREEREDADELRMAVKEVICDNDKERSQYEEALIAITVDESLNRYCQRIKRPDFWGGESELLVLSKLLCQPIIVYIPEHEHSKVGWGSSGYIPIAEYGTEFKKGSKRGKPKKVVRLLYSGRNHYDLLV
uniref:Ubiquitin thioesterase OTU n=1 Tax=Kalanchoe fedtschenkoi TaxID=63787 RepID=A0A7N0R8Q9_KALFE